MDKHHLNIQNQTSYCLNNLWYDRTSMDVRMNGVLKDHLRIFCCYVPCIENVYIKAFRREREKKTKKTPFLFDVRMENICRKLSTTLVDLCHHCFVWILIQSDKLFRVLGWTKKVHQIVSITLNMVIAVKLKMSLNSLGSSQIQRSTYLIIRLRFALKWG